MHFSFFWSAKTKPIWQTKERTYIYTYLQLHIPIGSELQQKCLFKSAPFEIFRIFQENIIEIIPKTCNVFYKSFQKCNTICVTAEVQAHTTLLHPHGRVCTFKKYSGVHSCVFLRSRRPFRPIQDRLICCAPQWSKFPFKITASSYLEGYI